MEHQEDKEWIPFDGQQETGFWRYNIWRCPKENRFWALDNLSHKWTRADYPSDKKQP